MHGRCMATVGKLQGEMVGKSERGAVRQRRGLQKKHRMKRFFLHIS